MMDYVYKKEDIVKYICYCWLDLKGAKEIYPVAVNIACYLSFAYYGGFMLFYESDGSNLYLFDGNFSYGDYYPIDEEVSEIIRNFQYIDGEYVSIEHSLISKDHEAYQVVNWVLDQVVKLNDFALIASVENDVAMDEPRVPWQPKVGKDDIIQEYHNVIKHHKMARGV